MSFQVYGNDESCLLNAIKVYQIAVEVRAPRITSKLCRGHLPYLASTPPGLMMRYLAV
jgi:hypothetical protein